MKNKNLIAFWKYDLFPHVLSGTITEICKDGLVAIKEYGNGMFKPILILPEKDGKILQNKLKNLQSEYRFESDSLKKKFEQERDKLIEIK